MGNLTIGRADLVLAIAIATCAVAHAVHAQDPPARIVVDVGDCVSLKSPDERLACFDRHVEAAKPNRSASSPSDKSVAASTPSAPPAAPSVASTSNAQPAAPLAASTPNTPLAAPSAASAPAPAQPSVSTQSDAAERAVHEDPQHGSKAKPQEIVATVTELHETVPNAWLITLDNGQVWRQNPPQRFALKPGQRVTLRATKWGTSYRLSADALSGFIQVERVR